MAAPMSVQHVPVPGAPAALSPRQRQHRGDFASVVTEPALLMRTQVRPSAVRRHPHTQRRHNLGAGPPTYMWKAVSHIGLFHPLTVLEGIHFGNVNGKEMANGTHVCPILEGPCNGSSSKPCTAQTSLVTSSPLLHGVTAQQLPRDARGV